VRKARRVWKWRLHVARVARDLQRMEGSSCGNLERGMMRRGESRTGEGMHSRIMFNEGVSKCIGCYFGRVYNAARSCFCVFLLILFEFLLWFAIALPFALRITL
jgi:hypothetical protein